MRIESPQEYLDAAPEAGRPWLREFWDHMDAHHPELEATMFRQVPMYKFGKSYLDGYVMFTAAKDHFAVHALEFERIAELREELEGSKGGKGNISVKYSAEDAKDVLKAFVDHVVANRPAPASSRR